MQSSGREQTGEATTINVHGGTQTLATARRRRKTQPGAEARDRPAGGCHGVQHGEALQGTAPRRGRRTGVTLVTDASMISFLNGRRKMARYLMLNSTSPVRDLMTPSVTSSSSKRSTCPSTHCHRFIFPRKSNTDTDRQEERDTNTQTHLHHVAAVHILAFHFVFELLLQCLQQLRTEKSRVDGHGMHQLLLHTPASAGSTPRNEDGTMSNSAAAAVLTHTTQKSQHFHMCTTFSGTKTNTKATKQADTARVPPISALSETP